MPLFNFFDSLKTIRRYGRVICSILVLIVLNVSIDIPDELLYRGNNPKQYEVNEMESIAEFVFEICLNEEDSFPETEGDDEGSEISKKENNWKPGLLTYTNNLISSTLFNSYTILFFEHYKSADYTDVPYAPPCSG